MKTFTKIFNTNNYFFDEDFNVYSTLRNQMKMIKPSINSSGYVQLSYIDKYNKKRTLQLGRLILMTFCPVKNMENLECDHINRNRQDNRLENLRWATKSENSHNRRTPVKRHDEIIVISKLDHSVNFFHKISEVPESLCSHSTIINLISNPNYNHYSTKYNIYAYKVSDFPEDFFVTHDPDNKN